MIVKSLDDLFQKLRRPSPTNDDDDVDDDDDDDGNDDDDDDDVDQPTVDAGHDERFAGNVEPPVASHHLLITLII